MIALLRAIPKEQALGQINQGGLSISKGDDKDPIKNSFIPLGRGWFYPQGSTKLGDVTVIPTDKDGSPPVNGISEDMLG